MHCFFLAPTASRGFSEESYISLFSSVPCSSGITCLKNLIHTRTPHSLLGSEKKKQQTQEKKKRGQLSQWLSGQKELLAAEHLWKNALLRSVNENGIFLKIWIQLGTIGTSKFGPLCFLKYLALKWAKSEVTFQKPPAFIPPYSQVALKILVVLMSSIMLKPVGKKRTHFSWLNAQVSSRHCFNNRLIRKFPNYLYCLRMLKERMLFLNFSITIK